MDGITFESTGFVSAEQFRAFVDEEERRGTTYRYELLNGRVVMNPPAGYPHGEVESEIVFQIRRLLTRAEGRVFGSSQGFTMPTGDVVEPDVSFVSGERWSAAPGQRGEFPPVVPDLVVEILSPKTASRDRGEKKSIYERSGVREYWLVDERARTVVVCRLIDGRYDLGCTFSEDDRVVSAVLPAFDVTVRELFPAA